MAQLNILFDKYGQQVVAQEGKAPGRLQPLFDAITAANWNYSISTGLLDNSSLAGQSVLVLTNRMQQPYEVQELSAIADFVRLGGGVWCMANHAGFNGSDQLNNHVRYDSAVSTTYFTSYEAAAYTGSPGAPVPLTGANLADHEIITGNSAWPLYGGNTSSQITEVVTRSFCSVYPSHFTQAVCGLSGLEGVANAQDGLPVTAGNLWMVALDADELTGSGRVLICADAGWLGSTTTNWPGPGEYQNGDNPQFSLNCLAWLGGIG